MLPAGTVTEGGTDAAAVLLLVRVTATPPAAAGPLSVTLPVALLPPVTVAGLTLREVRAGGFTVNIAVWVALPYAAEIVTAAGAATA